MYAQSGNMTPTTPQTPRSATPSNDRGGSNDHYRVVRKRNRVPLSCAPCRNRKLKCNRSSPCENCVKRGDVPACSYAAVGGRRKTIKSTSSETPDLMQNRIDRLEGMVMSLMTNETHNASPAVAARALAANVGSDSQDYSYMGTPSEEMTREDEGEGDSETDQMAKSLGVLHVANNRAMYVEDGHWAAILHDISEVRNYFNEHKKIYDDQASKILASKIQLGMAERPAILYGGRHVPELPELLASLPPRDALDKMVARYFNDYDPAIHILHPKSWRKTYENHWADPANTDPAFLGQLFAICCLAMHSYHRGGIENEPYEFRGRTWGMAATFRSLTAQCLLLADCTKPVNHMVETMILHLHGEFAKSRESEVGVWVLVGMIVRLAMRMGMHRDPSYYPNVTPFEAEMRRRIWTFVRQSDLLFSFQIGLPCMIRLGDCDTALPRNIFDDEFDENTKVLPPSRPPSEITQVSYMIAKSTLSFVFGKIVERLQAITTLSYDEIMDLDKELRETYATLPSFMRFKPLEDSLMDTIAVLVMRFQTSILYNKGMCVLHRRYLSKARGNNRYAHSRRTCMDSSMELLRYQATLHTEARPGRRLHGMKWYINSLTTHDFLLAATLVCLDLWCSAQTESMGRSTGDLEMWGSDRRIEMIEAVKISRDLWVQISDQSMEAFKASGLLTVMLKKVDDMHHQNESRKALSAFEFAGGIGATNPVPQFNAPDEEKPEHSAAITLGMLSTGGVPMNPPGVYNGAYMPVGSTTKPGLGSSVTGVPAPAYPLEPQSSNSASVPSPFSFLTDNSGPMDSIDWDAWDSYVQSANLDPDFEPWPVTAGVPTEPLLDTYGQHAATIARDVQMRADTPPGAGPLL